MDDKKISLKTISEKNKTFFYANNLKCGKYKIEIARKCYDISVYNHIQSYVYE